MKKNHDELKRQAYKDDQLSVDEIIELEQSLNNKAKAEIQDEKDFEDAFIEILKEDAECPDDLWAETKARIAYQSRSRFRFFTLLTSHIRLVSSAAAILLILGGAILVRERNKLGVEEATIPIEFPRDLREFSGFAEVPGGFEVVRSSLAAKGFFVNLKKPDPGETHDIQLLGVRYHRINGKDVAQLFFSCCMRPVIAFLSRDSLEFRDNVIQATAQQHKRVYKAYSDLENYKLMIFGPHPPNDILDLFS